MKSRPSLPCFSYLIKRCSPLSPAHAQANQGRVHCDASEPRGESRTPMEAIQVAESIEKCRLNGVLRIFSIAKNPLGNTKESVPVRHTRHSNAAESPALADTRSVASSLATNEGPRLVTSFGS